MSEWISQTDFKAKLGHKLLLAGLSEAGKTAVKRIFFLKHTTKDVDSLGATINYERMNISINNFPITIVDLGGQKIFLQRFLSGFSPFVFSSVKIFLFLIDVANKTSRNNSIEYFKGCIEKLEKFSPEAQVFIFLHKNDLVKHSPNYESIHNQLKEQFQLEYTKTQIPFFRTTIYKPETVIKAFGRIFELSIPEIAKSDFVDNREIGTIEEYLDTQLTIREEVEGIKQIQLGNTPQDELPLAPADYLKINELEKAEINASFNQSSFYEFADSKVAGDPNVLRKLQNLMRQASMNNEGVENIKNFTNSKNGTFEEFISESKRKILLNTQIIDIETPNSSNASKELEPIIIKETKEIERENHLIDFYGIDINQARQIVKLGYDNLFESIAATSAIDISVILNIFLEVIPFLKSKNMNIENLTEERIFMAFLAFIKGKITENDLIKSIIFLSQKPEMSVEEIIERFLSKHTGVSKSIQINDRAGIEERYDTEEANNDTNSTINAIAIPYTNNLGCKFYFQDLNIRLEFHDLMTNTLSKRILGRTTVAPSISKQEIIYLLTYEMNLIASRFFEGNNTSIDKAAEFIVTILQKMLQQENN